MKNNPFTILFVTGVVITIATMFYVGGYETWNVWYSVQMFWLMYIAYLLKKNIDK